MHAWVVMVVLHNWRFWTLKTEKIFVKHNEEYLSVSEIA
jgi:hypothetical protein